MEVYTFEMVGSGRMEIVVADGMANAVEGWRRKESARGVADPCSALRSVTRLAGSERTTVVWQDQMQATLAQQSPQEPIAANAAVEWSPTW